MRSDRPRSPHRLRRSTQARSPYATTSSLGAREVRRACELQPDFRARARDRPRPFVWRHRENLGTFASSLTGPLATSACRRLGHALARRPHRPPRRWLRASTPRASSPHASWPGRQLAPQPHCGLFGLDLTAHYFCCCTKTKNILCLVVDIAQTINNRDFNYSHSPILTAIGKRARQHQEKTGRVV